MANDTTRALLSPLISNNPISLQVCVNSHKEWAAYLF